jgi:hypothetical protein
MSSAHGPAMTSTTSMYMRYHVYPISVMRAGTSISHLRQSGTA